MLVRASKFLLVVLLVATTGWQWAMLQTLAWTTMLANNLQTASLEMALTKTFDGLHPCCLCRAIAAAKKSEKKDDSAVIKKQKPEYPPADGHFFIRGPKPFKFLAFNTRFSSSFQLEPPTPPPRDSLS